MKSRRLSTVLLPVLLWCGAFYPGCGSDDTAPTDPSVDEQAGNYSRAEGFSFTRNHEGRIEWEIKAKSAVYSDDRKSAEFDDVEAFFYPSDSGTVRLIGKKGRFDVEKQDIMLTDGVRLISSRGYTMTTQDLRYTQADRTIRTDSEVFVHGDGMAMSCTGLVISLEDERLEFQRNVKSTLWNTDVLKSGGNV